MIVNVTTRVAAVAAVIAAVAFGSACKPTQPVSHDYVVQSVEPSEAGAADGIVKVTCASTTDPAKTKTKQWDGSASPAPVVGDEWLCNSGAG
jgi:poly(3-hydroxybutyrate) depolymerase